MSTAAPGPSRSRHLVVLGLCSGMLAIGGLVRLDDDRVQIGGISSPSVCWVRGSFEHGCPGCGLTRSVVASCHLRWADAFRLHPAGLLVCVVALFQIAYRIACLVRRSDHPWYAWAERAGRGAMVVVLVVSFIHWLEKLA